MSTTLPPSADLNWLRKSAKRLLKDWRAAGREAKLAEAQFAIATEYGFSSWRALKAHLDDQGLAERNAFLRLVGNGDLAGVAAALSENPDLASAVGDHPFWGGKPQPLHLVVEANRQDMFDLLLDHGADVAGQNAGYDNWSPLMLALFEQRDDMTAQLRANGAPMGLCESLLAGDDAALDAHLARPNWRDTPIPSGSLIALARTPHAVGVLHAAGVSPDDKDRWGSTAMDALSRLGTRGTALVATLAELGTALSPQDIARLGDLPRLQRLVADTPSALDDPKVILAAVDFEHLQSVEWLLAQGANVNARHSIGSAGTALHSAAWNGDMAMVDCLLAHGANDQALDVEYRTTPLIWARTAARVTNNPKCLDVAARLEDHAAKT